jgi:hypothetical protein
LVAAGASCLPVAAFGDDLPVPPGGTALPVPPGGTDLPVPPGGTDLPVPPGGAIGFKVLRNGNAIGEHHLNFTRDGADLRIDIAVNLLVTVMGIAVFRYTAMGTERWSGGVFQSLDTQVNHNGNPLEVHAHKVANGYDVVGINHNNPEKSYPEYTAPPNTMPLTYWNRASFNGTLLNVETAHSYPAIVNSPGWENLPTANGGTITAHCVTRSGPGSGSFLKKRTKKLF